MCDINVYYEQSVCFTCLSSNRKLTPLGNFSYIFLEICNYLLTIPPEDMNICWECSAVLKRISDFKEKAFKAQEILNECNFESQKAAQSSLSNLTVTQTNNEITTVHAEVKTEETFELNEFKLNDQLDSSKGSRLIPDIKTELEVDDDDKDDYQIDFDNDEFPYELKLEDIKNETVNTSKGDIKKKKKEEKTRKAKSKRKYRFISIKRDIGTLVKDVEIDERDIHESAVLERDNDMFKSLPYKCKSCLCAWKERFRMLRHNKRCHSVKSGNFKCDICSSRFPSEELLKEHSERHRFRRKCVICGFECFAMCVMREHLLSHKNMRKCVDCDEYFTDWVMFRDHYRSSHSTRICDYCGKRFMSLLIIEKHIKREHLSSHHCTICDKQFKHDRALKNHQTIFHVTKRDESTYCVQCDKQFDNAHLYRRHVLSSVAHAHERKVRKRETSSCPVCAKVYARKTYMMNHYNMVHAKRTRFYCEQCDKYFLTSTHYKNHKDYTHKGLERKRDKLCTLCGRGFSSNKILTNHMRTHTGERPYECSYCSAKFAQSYALKSHEKHIHLKIKRKDK